MANKRKRGNGEGSVFKRTDSNGKVIGWRGQQYIGDKRKSYSGKTKDMVIEKMALDRADFNRGVYVHNDDITVGQWISDWLEHDKKPYVKAQSYYNISGRLNKYILPYLRDVRLQDLTPDLISRTYYKAFVETTTVRGTSYSESTIKQTATYFKGCLNDAVDSGKLVKNPHNKKVKLPNGRPAKEVRPYSPEEQQKIVAFCKGSQLQHDHIIYFLIATGLRVGEAVVLTWDDIDFQKNKININKTFAQINGVYFVQEQTKTAKGTREIVMPKKIHSFLKKKKQETDHSKNYKNLVFPNSLYNHMSEVSLRRRFQKVCAILDMDYYGLHALRHTWATRCLEKNVPIKTVSEMLGHEDVLVTMNIYQSVLPNQQEEVATIMNDLI